MGHLCFQATSICHRCQLSHFRTKGHIIDCISLVDWISHSPGWPWTFYVVKADPSASTSWGYRHPHAYLLDVVLSRALRGAGRALYPLSHIPVPNQCLWWQSRALQTHSCDFHTPKAHSPQPAPCLRLDHSPWSIIPKQVLLALSQIKEPRLGLGRWLNS